MNKYLLLTLPIFAFAAPAQAQEQERATSGFRVEGMIFYDDLDADDIDDTNTGSDSDVDVAYGVGVGYDFLRTGRIHAGVDLEFTESTASREIFVTGITTSVAKVKLGNDIYVGGRVTATLTGPWRAHLKLGYTSLKTSTKITRTGFDEDDFPDGDFNLDKRLGGYRAGVGVLYGSDEDRTYYGAEYRYSDYERGVERHQIGVVIGARF